MNESQLVQAIKVHIAKGDKAADKADQHYRSAGQHLKTLRPTHGGSWAEWDELLKTKVGIGKSRASELMRIADGTKTVEQVRAESAERKAKERAKSLRDVTEKSVPLPSLRSEDNAGDPETSAEGMKAKFADADDDETPTPRELAIGANNLRNIFLMNCATAQEVAHYDGPADQRVLEAAEKAARAWNRVAASIRARINTGAPPNDDGLDIPESLRRAPKAAAP